MVRTHVCDYDIHRILFYMYMYVNTLLSLIILLFLEVCERLSYQIPHTLHENYQYNTYIYIHMSLQK